MGGQCSDDEDGSDGPSAAPPQPNHEPAHGGLKILVTTKIIYGPGRYRGQWLVGTNQRPTGNFEGGGG